MAHRSETLEVAGREVTISNPDKIFFPERGTTKLDLVRYYLAVSGGALNGVAGRPMLLKRFVNGVAEPAFFQKRAPTGLPGWISTVELRFPSGRTADEVVISDAAGLAWVVNLGCVDLNPHPVFATDMEHPAELRVDLDPIPGIGYRQVLDVALLAREVLADVGLTGWPKTSGSRGFHVYAPIEPRWSFGEVRSSAVALAREIERRSEGLATSKWWKEERDGVFVDYNQNAKDRTVASAYSVRPTPDARVSTPMNWDEVAGCDPAAFNIDTVPDRYSRIGDPWEGFGAAAGSLEPLLELARRDAEAGLPDAPWPPNYVRADGEEPRVAPSRRRSGRAASAPPGMSGGASGRRKSSMPLIEIARAASQAEALAGLDRWRARHPDAAALLEPADILLDAMRGRSSAWYRIRLNLRHIPQERRPPQETLEVDYDPWAGLGRTNAADS